MNLKKAYQNYQEIFLAFYAFAIIGVIAFFYVYGIVNMIEIASEATTIDKSAATAVEFNLEEAQGVIEQRKTLQKLEGGLED